MKKRHPKKRKCQLCDGARSALFSIVEHLVEHVRQEHMDSFFEEDLDAVRLWPSTLTIGIDTCPLCRSRGSENDPVFIKHVLEHTHDFALLSLPWADLPSENFQGPATSDFYDLRYLKRVEPVFYLLWRPLLKAMAIAAKNAVFYTALWNLLLRRIQRIKRLNHPCVLGLTNWKCQALANGRTQSLY